MGTQKKGQGDRGKNLLFFYSERRTCVNVYVLVGLLLNCVPGRMLRRHEVRGTGVRASRRQHSIEIQQCSEGIVEEACAPARCLRNSSCPPPHHCCSILVPFTMWQTGLSCDAALCRERHALTPFNFPPARRRNPQYRGLDQSFCGQPKSQFQQRQQQHYRPSPEDCITA